MKISNDRSFLLAAIVEYSSVLLHQLELAGSVEDLTRICIACEDLVQRSLDAGLITHDESLRLYSIFDAAADVKVGALTRLLAYR